MDTLIRFKQLGIFILLWLAYGSCYLLRKPFGIIKSDIQESFGLSDEKLGYLDLAFALPYALFSLFLGFIGDSFGPRRTLGCSLLGTAITSSFMGRSESYYELCILIFLSGAFQALCWPTACSILSAWFDKKSMSIVLAMYGTCMLAGGICSSILTIRLQAKSGWRSVFGVLSLVTVLTGLMVLCFGYPKPSKTAVEDVEILVLPEKKDSKKSKEENKTMSIRNVLGITNVPEISAAIFFIKGMRNAAMFWLPLYLMRALHYNLRDSGLIPLTFEVGGLIGSAVIIIILDKILKVSDLLTCTLASTLSGIAFLFLFVCDKFGTIFLHFILFIAGVFSSISDIMLSGSLPSKIGEEVNAMSSVVGVVNGIGSFGNIIEGPVVAWVSSMAGVQSFVFFCVLSCALSMLCTLKAYFTYRNSTRNKNDVDAINAIETIETNVK